MSEFKPYEVKEIYKTEYESTANEYLKLGWVLIDTFKTCYEPQLFPNQQTLHYVLGWIKEGTPLKPKSEYDALKTLEL